MPFKYQNPHVRRISALIRQIDAKLDVGGDKTHLTEVTRDLQREVQELAWECLGAHMEVCELTPAAWQAHREAVGVDPEQLGLDIRLEEVNPGY